jgi:hypothetical protein
LSGSVDGCEGRCENRDENEIAQSVFHEAWHFLFTGRTQEKNRQPDRGGNRDPAATDLINLTRWL